MSTNFEDLIIRDTRANQPAAGVPGRLYYVTDEETLERDSGSAWESVEGAGGTDDDAIHDNVDGEINAIAEKVTPVGADLVIIEDSAASYAKKKAQVSSLSSGSGAPTDAKYVVGEAHASLSAEIILPNFLEHPDIPPGSPSAYDDEFSAGSLDAQWTNVNSSSISFAGSKLYAEIPSASEALFRQDFAPGASTAFTITAKFVGGYWHEGTDYIGLQVFDSSNNIIAAGDIRATPGWYFNKDNPGGTANISMAHPPAYDYYFRITRDAADLYTFYYSPDCVNWMPLAGGTSNTTVAKIGFRCGQTASATWKRGGIEWFRVTLP